MFDFTNVAIETTVPVGTFNTEIIKAEKMKSKTDKDMIMLEFEIFGEKYQGYKLRKYILIDNEYFGQTMVRLCQAIKMEAKFSSFDVFVGKRLAVKTEKEVQGEYTNAVIKGFYNLVESTDNAPVINSDDIPF